MMFMKEQQYIFKVFIIDDSLFTRNTLMDLLPDLGFEIVGMASTAKNAFRYVADTRPDVVLLDVSLPGISADEVIRGLLAINPGLQIIILAPLSNQNEISKLLKYGARDFIPKPLVGQQVEYVLRTYELASGIRPQTEAEKIASIHSLFYNECLKHAPPMSFDAIHKAIHQPLKRIRRVYKDRYKI
ncbi:MAG: response regulator, partial [Candidatus Kariarchaeaceae archaeon]